MLVPDDQCFECGTTENIHNHHVVPKSKGGTKTIPLCGDCHGTIHDKSMGLHWRTLQMRGIERAKQDGKYTGRTVNSVETNDTFLKKPKSERIKKDLVNGYSITEIRYRQNCSFSTIYKVKRLIEDVSI